jgi:hypothetical protein
MPLGSTSDISFFILKGWKGKEQHQFAKGDSPVKTSKSVNLTQMSIRNFS